MDIIGLEHSELFALVLEKNAEFDFVYTQASTNINQSAPNLVKMYVTIRSQMSYTMDLIRTEHLELSALELNELLQLYPPTMKWRGVYWNCHGSPSVCLSVDTILSRAFLLQFCTYCSEIYT